MISSLGRQSSGVHTQGNQIVACRCVGTYNILANAQATFLNPAWACTTRIVSVCGVWQVFGSPSGAPPGRNLSNKPALPSQRQPGRPPAMSLSLCPSTRKRNQQLLSPTQYQVAPLASLLYTRSSLPPSLHLSRPSIRPLHIAGASSNQPRSIASNDLN